MNNNVHIVGDAQSGVTTPTKEILRMGVVANQVELKFVELEKQAFGFLDLANTLQIPPELITGKPSNFEIRKQLDESFFELLIKPFIARSENKCNLFDTLHMLDVLPCESCANFEVLPPSGRRWANRLRKQGWTRSGADWYCPNCKN